MDHQQQRLVWRSLPRSRTSRISWSVPFFLVCGIVGLSAGAIELRASVALAPPWWLLLVPLGAAFVSAGIISLGYFVRSFRMKVVIAPGHIETFNWTGRFRGSSRLI